jgi:hypothetical protein
MRRRSSVVEDVGVAALLSDLAEEPLARIAVDRLALEHRMVNAGQCPRSAAAELSADSFLAPVVLGEPGGHRGQIEPMIRIGRIGQIDVRELLGRNAVLS